MTSRIPKERTELVVDETIRGKGNNFSLEYYLLESEVEETAELGPRRTYGLEVVKKSGDAIVDTAAVVDYSTSLTETTNLIELLSKHGVTPVSLFEIVEDCLGA